MLDGREMQTAINKTRMTILVLKICKLWQSSNDYLSPNVGLSGLRIGNKNVA
jgi:hypothetical protein